MDGETLMMLSICASEAQLRACGLRTVKQQLHLRKLVSNMCTHPTPITSTTLASTSADSKLTMSAMRAMTPEERWLYLMKQ